MKGQKIQRIKVKDLILWTENPRDPIDKNATDQDVVDRALHDQSEKWALKRLAEKMGAYYDFSELPTVVFHGEKPIVYDGNRRIILAKISHGLVSVDESLKFIVPACPESLPCNVCPEETAIKNIYRKHYDSGSWQTLERDIFRSKYMNEPKSPFLVLNEETAIIDANPHLNKGFVKDEIFSNDSLKILGFDVRGDFLYSTHSKEDAYRILSDISEKVNKKVITTRNNRGRVVSVLEPDNQKLIKNNKGKPKKRLKVQFPIKKESIKKKIQTRRTTGNIKSIFGGKLYLRYGEVSDLYRDIADLYLYYQANKKQLSDSFSALIRMALRLLCETAAKDCNMSLSDYIQTNFDKAKSTLDKDIRTSMSTQNVTGSSIEQLLHIGAHKYEASKNIEQTLSISFAVGAMLAQTHGKEE